MNGRYELRQSTGWGTVVLVAVLGLVLAALVVLTPWHVSDLPGAGGGASPPRDTVVEVRAPAVGPVEAVPVADVTRDGRSGPRG
jgi:hypothetical protein